MSLSILKKKIVDTETEQKQKKILSAQEVVSQPPHIKYDWSQYKGKTKQIFGNVTCHFLIIIINDS
jgi:hypothetical protein